MSEIGVPDEVIEEYSSHDTEGLDLVEGPLGLTTLEEALTNSEDDIVVESLSDVSRFIEAHFTNELSRFELNGEETQFTPEHLPFHGVEHSRYVAESSVSLYSELLEKFPQLAAVGEPPEVLNSMDHNELIEYKLTKMYTLAWGHDVVQDFSDADGFRARVRGAYEQDMSDEQREAGAVGNEQASAKHVYRQLSRFKNRDGEPLFPHVTQREIQNDIAGTYPFVYLEQRPNEANKVLVAEQPYIDEQSSVEAFILAMVDLRENIGNSTDYDAYKRGSLAEFRELRIDFGEDIYNLQHKGELVDADRKEFIAETALNWMSVTDSFIRVQAELSETYVNTRFPLDAENPVLEVNAFLKQHFNAINFSLNAAEAEKRYREVETEYGCPLCVEEETRLKTAILALKESGEDPQLVDSQVQRLEREVALQQVHRRQMIRQKMTNANFLAFSERVGYGSATAEFDKETLEQV